MPLIKASRPLEWELSPDGIRGFKYGEYPPAVDHRTKPTGKTGKYTHPAQKTSNNGKPLEYKIHEPMLY